MANAHGAQIGHDEQYAASRRRRAREGKAAGIADASRSEAGTRGCQSWRYEGWSKDDLDQRAKAIGSERRSGTNQSGRSQPLRGH